MMLFSIYMKAGEVNRVTDGKVKAEANPVGQVANGNTASRFRMSQQS